MGNLRTLRLSSSYVCCLGLGLVACSGDEGGGRGSAGATGASAGEAGDAGSASDGSGGDKGDGSGGSDQGDEAGTGTDGVGDEGTGGFPKFDLGAIPDVAGPPMEEGCEKVDLLFVIDNSGSMADNQQNLVNSFPGFADTMLNTLEADEFHVGVVTSDAYGYNQAGCTAIGSLVTETYPSNVCTPFADGQRYMTQNDDLATKFACAGLPGDVGNGDEHQMEAAEQAVSAALNGPGACNEGFIRPDALLVLVVITDEDDAGDGLFSVGSPGDPNSWFNTFVTLKGGVETNVVVLTLTWEAANCPVPQSSERPGVRIVQFANMFTHVFLGDSCAPDYTPFLVDAVSVIDSACDGFLPPK